MNSSCHHILLKLHVWQVCIIVPSHWCYDCSSAANRTYYLRITSNTFHKPIFCNSYLWFLFCFYAKPSFWSKFVTNIIRSFVHRTVPNFVNEQFNFSIPWKFLVHLFDIINNTQFVFFFRYQYWEIFIFTATHLKS